MEGVLASAFGVRAMTRMLFAVRAQAGVAHAPAIVRGIKAASEVDLGASEVHPPSVATGFNACRPSGHRTMSGSGTGATGPGAQPEP